ncbi:protein kinase domain-containing protein [Sedimentibacter sp.]|uniref:protein kinase domain-containing protein n=1 Tax=Sedimentibacter sp. TaxID=1960295 RepID=UPI002899D81B|nr:protein kinase [Sedimentibacter sp.]
MQESHFCTEIIAEGYTLTEKLGSGLFGTCYLCMNKSGEPVVLKKYDNASFQINKDKNHYEASVLSTLLHTAIPKLFGILFTSDTRYLILEFKPGNTLKKFLFQEHKVYDDYEISRICTQLLSVMKYLHSRNIAHRDISIDNIIDDEKNISLVDFGLSRPIRYDITASQTDYYCFGEVLLFLLYSRYSTTECKNDNNVPWYKELRLSVPQKRFIGRLLGLERQFNNISEIINGFAQFMKKGLPVYL